MLQIWSELVYSKQNKRTMIKAAQNFLPHRPLQKVRKSSVNFTASKWCERSIVELRSEAELNKKITEKDFFTAYFHVKSRNNVNKIFTNEQRFMNKIRNQATGSGLCSVRLKDLTMQYVQFCMGQIFLYSLQERKSGDGNGF